MRNAGWRGLLRSTFAVGLLALVTGCPPGRRPPGEPLQPQPPIPMDYAITIVNSNAARIVSGLRAKGDARGQIVLPEGQKRSFDFSGTLLLIPPRHMRFDLQNGLGQTEVLFGSNEALFWLYVMRDEDTLRFGRYATPEEDRAQRPALRADWLIEALGLNPLPFGTTGPAGPVQIIEPDRQRLLFIGYADSGEGAVRKEYALSRYPPRLVEAVIYRDKMGAVKMRSELSEYSAVGADGPQLPHRLRVEWPAQEAWLEYRVSRWEEREELHSDHPAFQLGAPRVLADKYRHVIDIDSGQDMGKSAPKP